MSNCVALIALNVLLVIGCSTTLDDAKLKSQLVGTWRLDQDPSKTIQNKPDGTYLLQLSRGGSNVFVEGTWQVKDRCIIGTMTKAPFWYGPQDPLARQKYETNRVVQIDRHKVTLLSSQDGTTVLTAHREQ